MPFIIHMSRTQIHTCSTSSKVLVGVNWTLGQHTNDDGVERKSLQCQLTTSHSVNYKTDIFMGGPILGCSCSYKDNSHIPGVCKHKYSLMVIVELSNSTPSDPCVIEQKLC